MQVWGCSHSWNRNYLQPRRGRRCPAKQGDQFCSREQSGSIWSRRADIPCSCNKSQGEDPSWKARIQVGKPWTHGLQVSNKGRAGRGLRADVHRVHEWVWPTASPSGSPHRWTEETVGPAWQRDWKYQNRYYAEEPRIAAGAISPSTGISLFSSSPPLF